MPDLRPFKAIPINDCTGISMRRGEWRHDIPAADLPKWVALYRSLRDRTGGKFAEFHAPAVTALEAVATRIGVKIPPQKKGKA